MTKCIKLDQSKTQVCIGGMRYRIQILKRTLLPPLTPASGDYKSSEEFELVSGAWAMVKTQRGVVEFDDIEQNKNVITTLFYIRYLPNISQENWILFKNNYYNILTVKDIELRESFMEIACSLSGSQAKEGATA